MTFNMMTFAIALPAFAFRLMSARRALAAVAALSLGAAAAQTPDLDAGAGVLRRVARVQAAEPGDGRVEQASGFVIDRYNRLVLTSCRILFTERNTLGFEVAFAETPSVMRAADLLMCNRAVDLAVVRVRGFDVEFPRSVNPSPNQRIWPGDPLYVLGFAARTPTAIAVIADVTDTALPGVPGRFIGTRAKQPAADGAAAAHDVRDVRDLAELAGGPLVTAQGNLAGVNAFSSGERIRYAPAGVELAPVPKDGYFARTLETIVPLVQQALSLRP